MAQERVFSRWLKQRRTALDLTQWDLAERVGCSREAIQKIEAGTRRPSKQIAGLLTADELQRMIAMYGSALVEEFGGRRG